MKDFKQCICCRNWRVIETAGMFCVDCVTPPAVPVKAGVPWFEIGIVVALLGIAAGALLAILCT